MSIKINRSLHTHRHGFTIVELLVVVVIVGILASVVIVAYNRIAARAVDAALKADLTNAAKQLGVYMVSAGAYPGDTTSLSASNGTVYQYTVNSSDNSYCLSATSSQSDTAAYHISSATGKVESGLCAGHTMPGSTPALLPNNGVVTTIAGSVYGLSEGTGTAAKFSNPSGVTVDASGNVYVADSSNYRIRKMTSAGAVSTLAGTGVGYSDGAGTTAQFYDPSDVAVDSSGNVFVADQSNHKIRKINPAGVVSTFAGSTSGNLPGDVDGTGAAASFNYPYGVAVATDGTVYVADSGNHRIRKITPAGEVTTVAGSTSGYIDANGTAAKFSYPSDVAIGSTGILYVADSGNRRIRAISTTGDVTTLAGSTNGYLDGTGSAARFSSLSFITINSEGSLYVTDAGSTRRIRKITSAGEVTTLAGSGTSGNTDATGTAASFTTPMGITVDATGLIYVSDPGSHLIRKIR